MGRAGLRSLLGMSAAMSRSRREKIRKVRIPTHHIRLQRLCSSSRELEALDEAIDKCRADLFLSNPEIDRANLISAKGDRVTGTCEWIQKNARYHAWSRGETPLLWICGGPGKGKTMLSIYLTQSLEKETQVIYYFCSSEDEQRSTSTAVLRGLIWQVTAKRRELTQHVLPYFDQAQLAQATLASRETLWSILAAVLRDPALGELVCVLDGLDDCDTDSTRWLVAKLVQFFSLQEDLTSRSTAARLVIVSRDVAGLRQTAQVKLDPDNDDQVAIDIKEFAATKVHTLSGLDGYSETFGKSVQEALLARAEGTFLWIGFVMDELSRKTTCTEVLETLKALPHGLYAYYSRMLLRIQPIHRQISALILRWVTLAQRHLTVRELGSAIDVQDSAGAVTVDLDRLVRDRIRTCGALIRTQGEEVSLVHHSAREYLLRAQCDSDPVLEDFRIRPETANVQIARRCLDCIEHSGLKHKSLQPNDFLNEAGLLEYSVSFWFAHAADDSPEVDALFTPPTRFFEEESELQKSWWKTYQALCFRRHTWEIQDDPPLQVAASLGVSGWVKALLMRRSSKFRPGSRSQRRGLIGALALKTATSRGHGNIVSLLLNAGVDVNARDEDQRTALFHASRLGEEKILRELLIRGAKVNAKDKERKTALHKAAASGNEKVARLLLEHGAEQLFGLSDGTLGHTPISEAIWKGHSDIVRLLLDYGAAINKKDDAGRKALATAAWLGNKEIMRLLIDRGADFCAQDKSDALCEAARAGNVAAMHLLLDLGASPNAPDHRGETPLSQGRVAWSKSEAVVTMLLDRGASIHGSDTRGNLLLHWTASRSEPLALRLLRDYKVDVHARNKDGRTALHLAASAGCEAIVRMLLDYGARVNAEDNSKQTALHGAIPSQLSSASLVHLLLDRGAIVDIKASAGAPLLHEAVRRYQAEMVRALLGHGARVNETDKDGSTALHAAASCSSKGIAQILLVHGADVNSTDAAGKTALHLAATARSGAEVSRVLLDAGAMVNIPDNSGRDPLYYAASSRSVELIRLLLGCGANVHARDDNGTTAMHRAVSSGGVDVVQTMLQYGARIHEKDQSGRNALILAAAGGHLAMVRFLLDRAADVNTKLEDGSTALHRAAQRGYQEMARTLLKHGADANVKDKDGKTALDWAMAGRHPGMVLVLRTEASQSLPDLTTPPNPTSRNLVIVGDGACGKTALLTVWAKGTFPEYSAPSFDQFDVDIEAYGHYVRFIMLDTPGQEDYDRLRPLSYVGVHVVLICFSIESPDSLDNVEEKWISEILHFCQGVPILLVGCKKDLRHDHASLQELRRTSQEPVSPEQAEEVRKRIGAEEYLECSAKYNDGVQEVLADAALLAMSGNSRAKERKQKREACQLM